MFGGSKCLLPQIGTKPQSYATMKSSMKGQQGRIPWYTTLVKWNIIFVIAEVLLFLACSLLVWGIEHKYEPLLDENGWYCLSNCCDVNSANASTSGLCSHDNETGINLLYFVNIMYFISSLLSTFFTAGMLGLYATRSHMRRSFHMQPVACLALNDMIYAIKFVGISWLGISGQTRLYHDVNKNGTLGCDVSSLVGAFCAISSVLWNLILGVNLFLMLSRPLWYARASHSKRLIAKCAAVAWGCPLLAVLSVYFSGGLGLSNDGTCWLTGNWVLFMFVPLLFSFVWVVFTLLYAVRRLMTLGGDVERSQNILELVVFTLAFYLDWFWPAILFLDEDSSRTYMKAYEFLAASVSIGLTGAISAGVWYSLVFRGRSKKTRTKKMNKDILSSVPENEYASFKLIEDDDEIPSHLPHNATFSQIAYETCTQVSSYDYVLPITTVAELDSYASSSSGHHL
jgi:hypothetical protein